MFTNASKFEINGGQFTNVNNTYSTKQTGIDILLEASTPEAAHDSSARDPPPRCFAGTREEFVEDIVQWAIPPVGVRSSPIYWMKGPAGVGKSAVAQTCVEKLKRQGTHCAAFFFSVNERNNHQKFFPSIAHQLATINSDYHELIDKKIHRNKTLVNKTMETQFWGLIVEPLQELEESGKGIGERIAVFVDGLDECESQDAQCEIIEIVAAAARECNGPLCWAIFSRPEPHIEAALSKPDISSLCHTTILPISHDTDGDIELYLRANFRNILRRLKIAMPSPWPSDSDMKMLVHAAGGLFIFAKTVLRFVGQPGSLNPKELLKAIIAVISNRNQDGTAPENPFAELDAFYLLIMQRIPSKMLPVIHRVLAVLCYSTQGSSAAMFANTIGISKAELEAACYQMSSTVHFEPQSRALKLDPTIDTNRSFLQTGVHLPVETWSIIRRSLGGSISFYHKSFKDFLLDDHRSGTYCIHAMRDFFAKRQREVALRFEMCYCWQDLDLVIAPDAPNLVSSLPYPGGNELVASIIEASIYYCIKGENQPFGADFDFRKHLFVCISITRAIFQSKGVVGSVHRCAGFRKCARRTVISWLQPGEFSRFDISLFKKEIESRQRKNIARPHHLPPPLLKKYKGRVETGLYVIGCGLKSILWYWEIDYGSKSYREFRTTDLAEGEQAYRKQFGSDAGDTSHRGASRKAQGPPIS